MLGAGMESSEAKRLSPEEHAARGRAVRKVVKRSSHGEWAPAAGRPSARSILARQDAVRVQELVPIRYGRMLDSAVSFYRGAAAVMASDLAASPSTGLEVQLCGDAHLSNFGFFAAPDRRLVFDVNDFDETLPGPFEWDVKRMAASFAVAGRARGLGPKARRRVTIAALREYREAMRRFAAMGDLDVWYARLDVETVFAQLRPSINAAKTEQYEKALAKARRKDSRRALSRLTEVVDGTRRIVSDPPVIVPIEELRDEDPRAIESAIHGLIDAYLETLDAERRTIASRYRYVHAARKVVGVGSVGTEAWILLLVGRDDDDPLVLQAKEAQRSVLEPFARPSAFAHQGRRVVEGQRLMQAASDIFLGWLDGYDERRLHYYVRQLWDGKRSAEIETLTPNELATYGRLCGWTLARAHARSGDRIAIAAYLGGSDRFDAAVADFAEAYADQNQRDYEELMVAVEAGELEVRTGV
jgi:uncharacterized protein (DUF2252 family)